MTDMLDKLRGELSAHGMLIRGGLRAGPDMALPDAPDDATGQTLVLIGHDARSLWPAFAAHANGDDHPLDRWTREVISPLAKRYDARAYYPSDQPYQPFLRWSMAAEPVWSSPLGMLIHAEYGLFHAYRAALVFASRVDIPPSSEARKPCDSCADRPCLSGCPVGAFSDDGYDVDACVSFLKTDAGQDCINLGCRARRACPIGAPYVPEQAAFHMKAFLKARGG